MTKARRLLVPGLSTLAMLVVLLGLGTWQVERLAWKTALLAQIDAAERLPAVPYTPGATPFAKVRITGHLRTGAFALYGAEGRDTKAGPAMGAYLLGVLDREGGDPVIVDLGWVPQNWHGTPTDPGAFDGYVRPIAHAHWFSAPDNPAARRFYTLDPALIGAALGVPKVAPFTLVVVGQGSGDAVPDPVRDLPRPPNNHLSYAITWYGLAAALLVIFFSYARKVLRS